MRTKFFVIIQATLVACILFMMGCNSAKKSTRDEIEKFGISAYTSGTISRESRIRIVFNVPVQLDSSKYNAPLQNSPISFNPPIKGTTVWITGNKLEFRPAERLKAGQTYKASLKLASIRPKSKENFEFSFTAMQQSFELSLDGLNYPNPENLKLQHYTGSIITADVEQISQLEKILKASQNGKQLPIRWNHSENKNEHRFIIDSITRGNDSSSVELSWNGDAIGVKEKSGKQILGIPSIKSFSVTAARPNQLTESYIELRFSDPLDKKQNLKGLIRTSQNHSLKFTIESNIVKIYTTSNWSGQLELTVDRSVRNSMGNQLNESWTSSIYFEDIKPQVRFSGKGVIVPTTQGLTIPIETVNLRAVVVEVTRIFENTIPQFMQVNDLEGTEQMTRVGRVVWKKLVKLDPLESKRNQWSSYGLDISELLKDNPGGLYRFKINFKSNHIIYQCNNSEESQDITSGEMPLEDEVFEIEQGGPTDESESSSWDSYEENNWSDNYDNRENPCHPGYYGQFGGHDITVSRNVLISDIGIIAKKDQIDSVKIVVTDLRNVESLENVTVKLFDYQQQLLSSGKTDRNGMLSLHSPREPFLIVAENGTQRGYLKLLGGSNLSVSHFDVSGDAVRKGIKGFIYGERGVWRPGDTLFLTFILNDPEKRIPANHPITFELYDSKNRQVKTLKTHQSINGFYSFKIPTNQSDPTGDWNVKVKAGGVLFEKPLKIETIMPNRLKIKIDFGKSMITSSETLEATLSAQWLHGAIAQNLKADVNVKLNKAVTKFPKYEEYIFDDPILSYQSEESSIFDGELDENGSTPIKVKINAENQSPGMLNAQFSTRVFEPGGAFSIDRFTIPYHPYESYIGIRTPKGDKARGMLLTDTTQVVSIVGIKPDGSTVQSKDVEVKIFKISWRWWWEKGEESFADYQGSSSFTAIKCDTIKVRNGSGEWKFNIKYPDWGRYMIRATDIEGRHSTGKIVYIDWPGWAGRAQKDAPGGASVLNFASDKSEYNVGENVIVTIPAGKKGRGLVSIENGSKILKQEWVDGNQESIRYQFEATTEMTPNIYVSVTYIQPHLTSGNDVPIRTYGVIPVKIIDPATRLQPQLKLPDVFAPEQKATISISESNGKPMTYTLAVVDEGLLDLTRFATPDPWEQFFKREALGIKTWDLFDMVSGAYGATLEKMLSIGGDDEGEGSKKKQANRFPPMVRYYGPFTLVKGKTNNHEIDIPQYIGSVRVMVVAGENGAFGKADQAVPVRKPIMILGTLPRVLSIKEEANLPISVFALDPKVKNVTLSISTEGPLKISGEEKKTITFSQVGDQVISFKAIAGQRPGIAKVTIKATGAGEETAQTIELDIRNPGSNITDIVDSTTAPGKNWKQKLTMPGIAGTNNVTLEVSRIPPLNLGVRLQYLIQYPHGCIEQTTSSVFPQLYLNKLLDLSKEEQSRMENNIKAGISRLRTFQTSNGGFSYWPGNTESDEWGSNYAGHFLTEAKRAGYLVPEGIFQQWVYYQQNKARAWATGSDHSELIQAYRLYTLALSGNPDLGAMNRLSAQTKLNTAEKWTLAAAYQLAGQQQIAADLVRNQSTIVSKYLELSNTFGSDIRDKAMILEALVLLNQMEKAAPLAKDISKELATGEWYSTQTTAYSLISLARYAGVAGNSVEMKFSVKWPGSKQIDQTSTKPIVQIPLNVNNETTADFEFTNKGSVTLFPRFIISGTPEIGTEKDASNGLVVNVSYENMDKNSIDPVSLEQGTDLIATVTVKNTGTRGKYDQIALSHLVPSGWEIHNDRLSSDYRSEKQLYDFRDVRDDRVYTYFSLNEGETKTFKVMMNASYCGSFYLPMIAAEAMYDATINGRVAGKWIKIEEPGKSGK